MCHGEEARCEAATIDLQRLQGRSFPQSHVVSPCVEVFIARLAQVIFESIQLRRLGPCSVLDTQAVFESCCALQMYCQLRSLYSSTALLTFGYVEL